MKAKLASSQVYSDTSSKGLLVKVSSQMGGHSNAISKPIQVFDEDGNDVTPIPLVATNIYTKAHGKNYSQSGNDIGLGKDSVADVLNNLESMAFGGSWNASVFDRSGMAFNSHSSKASGNSASDDDDSNSIYSNDSDDNDLGVNDSNQKTKQTQNDASLVSQNMVKPTITDTELMKTVHLTLQETDTICLIDIPSVCISNDYIDELAIVKAANARYKDLKANRQNNDNLVDKTMQTFNYAFKNKDVQATALKYVNSECMVNQWSIYDAYQQIDDALDTDEGLDSGKDAEIDAIPGLNSVVGGGSSMVGMTIADTSVSNMASEQCIPDDSNSESGRQSVPGIDSGLLPQPVPPHQPNYMEIEKGIDKDAAFFALNQENLQESLLIMERAVVGNNYMHKLLAYRNVPELPVEEVVIVEPEVVEGEDKVQAEEIEQDDEQEDVEESENIEETESNKPDQFATNIPSMQFLWSFRCELTRGRVVMYMAWNKHNEDILSIAYGECKSNPASVPGLVLCWSLKNPEWPERIYKSQSPVTAIDFSKTNSNLLAVGYMDGRISIYDVRRKDPTPVLDNSGMAGKHRETIWELKWVERERVHGDEQSRGENLVSISTDGRVTQWIIRKGLEFTDLMTLKRVNKQENKSVGSNSGNMISTSKTGAFISRLAGGLCFDFNPKDPNIYIVGTDDGHIHRCSCALYEQYLATHFGHTGPVYRLRWSPYLPGTFLSCSADWTVRLWSQDAEEPIFKFQSGKDSISDIAWSPACSTIFGCVSTDGRMEIWDLQFSVLDPAILHSVLDRQLTCIIFATKTPVVLIGDDNGAVNVYKLQQLPTYSNMTNEEQGQMLSNVISAKNQGSTATPGVQNQPSNNVGMVSAALPA
ncbi:WD repeat-containing protein 78 [Clydaea vesicula]|uniref:Dynein axonemal intermediate chain 4 n=1 Tax=Clydaea vesicula TaxID=447962 RepID=A0AAD5U7S5_9FUNG|nr:WD repeat-containing protein 78 [Clydaea vesicula]